MICSKRKMESDLLFEFNLAFREVQLKHLLQTVLIASATLAGSAVCPPDSEATAPTSQRSCSFLTNAEAERVTRRKLLFALTSPPSQPLTRSPP